MATDELFHVGDVVRHKGTGMVGKVARFAHDGTTDFWADNDTGPYKQAEFERIVPASRGGRSLEEMAFGDACRDEDHEP